MLRLLVLVMLYGACFISFTGCAKKSEDVTPAKPQKPQGHGDMKPSLDGPPVGMGEVVKKQKLVDYPDRTVGEAFGTYRHFDAVNWSETRLPKGTYYIDYHGTKKVPLFDEGSAKKGVAAEGVEVKFAIKPGGAFYVAMVSRAVIGTDGKMTLYPLPDKKKILDAIYANKEIAF